MVDHAFHATLARSHELSDGAEVFFGRVDGHVLERLVRLAVDLLGHNLWLAHGELEAFAAHVLDENRECELATSLNFPHVGASDVDDTKRHVTDELAVEAILDHACRELVTLDLADQR